MTISRPPLKLTLDRVQRVDWPLYTGKGFDCITVIKTQTSLGSLFYGKKVTFQLCVLVSIKTAQRYQLRFFFVVRAACIMQNLCNSCGRLEVSFLRA